ncbi:acylphosphatase [Aspergillus fumigatus Af293]|uniref:Acylphosphatase-like domain-containing protein n=2 Tax=Aspergillus fumigatus TaxID=746128 RepID=Q4WHK7_ASPFU|nr:hypothetical protein AFUA_2G05050 [Aspergillus fumigatus Af293]EAL87598.1 hypothetical protein AFUA_2G05050 [Aspergillus fumigatus Af293]EDP54156.1 hypothetical protein AFUB_022080 [Aspergillus fumigatus A1163]
MDKAAERRGQWVAEICTTDTVDRGGVEGEVQGNEETLQKFFKDIDKGPRLAHVVKLEKRDLSPEEGEDHFVVRRTSDSVFEATK